MFIEIIFLCNGLASVYLYKDTYKNLSNKNVLKYYCDFYIVGGSLEVIFSWMLMLLYSYFDVDNIIYTASTIAVLSYIFDKRGNKNSAYDSFTIFLLYYISLQYAYVGTLFINITYISIIFFTTYLLSKKYFKNL